MKKPEILAAYKANPKTEFAIVKAGVHYGKGDMNLMVNIRQEKTVKVRLVDVSPRDTRYTNKVALASFTADRSLLPLAPQGDRRPGLAVIDELNLVYVVEPSVFINTSAEFEKALTNHATLKAQQEAEQLAREHAEKVALIGASDRVRNATEQLKELLADLVSNLDDFSYSINLSTQLKWKDEIPYATMTGDVRLDYKLILKLTNLIQDLKEKENK